MLKRNNRLTKNKEFERLFKSGRAAFGRFIGLKYLPNDSGILRATVIVGKKVSKKAVVRNLIKRRLREIIRQDLDLAQSFDLAVIVLPEANKADFSQLKAEFDQLAKSRKLALL